MSSPFLFVFGNNHVTFHTGTDDIPSDAGDAKRRREGSHGIWIAFIYEFSFHSIHFEYL